MRLRPPLALVSSTAHLVLRSLRLHFYGLGHLHAATRASSTGTTIMCLWHQSLLSLVAGQVSMRIRLAALASLSGDGDIIADYMKHAHIRPVRGSSARGSARAAKEIMEVLADQWHVAIAIDGPRGPFKVVKTGPLEVARRHGVPVVPVAARASAEVSVPSWDRFRVPLPGAHVAIVFGSPFLYPPTDPTDVELQARAQAVRAALEAQEERATRLVRRFAPRSRFRPRPCQR